MGRMDAVRLPEESKSTRDLNMVDSSYLHQSSDAVSSIEHRAWAQPHRGHQPTITHTEVSLSHHCHGEGGIGGKTPFSLTWRKEKSVMQPPTIQTWSVAWVQSQLSPFTCALCSAPRAWWQGQIVSALWTQR